MLQRQFYVYLLTNFTKSVLYTGVTNDLQQRIIEHYNSKGQAKSFTGRYNVYYLLWYEVFESSNNAIRREKEIKGLRRSKKLQLIEQMNPEFTFLNEELFGKWPPDELPSRI